MDRFGMPPMPSRRRIDPASGSRCIRIAYVVIV